MEVETSVVGNSAVSVGMRSRLRQNATDQADGRCEYYGLSQTGQVANFPIDHIIRVAARGPTRTDNLVLAPVSCSLRKGARQTGVDPANGQQILLFHPRLQIWSEHSPWKGVTLVGLTASGRGTIALLRLNRLLMLSIREEKRLLQRHPPLLDWQKRR